MVWKTANIYEETYNLARDFVKESKKNPLENGYFSSIAVLLLVAIKEHAKNRKFQT